MGDQRVPSRVELRRGRKRSGISRALEWTTDKRSTNRSGGGWSQPTRHLSSRPLREETIGIIRSEKKQKFENPKF